LTKRYSSIVDQQIDRRSATENSSCRRFTRRSISNIQINQLDFSAGRAGQRVQRTETSRGRSSRVGGAASARENAKVFGDELTHKFETDAFVGTSHNCDGLGH
jgi:hypothetical protein